MWRRLGLVLPAPDDASQFVHGRRVKGITGCAELKSEAGIAKGDTNGSGLRPFARGYCRLVGQIAPGRGCFCQILVGQVCVTGIDPRRSYKTILGSGDRYGYTALRIFKPEPRKLRHHRKPQTLFLGVEINVLHCQRRRVKPFHSIDFLNSREHGLLFIVHDLFSSFLFFCRGTKVFRYWSHAGSSVVMTRPISF